jgi:hypothetical protein
VHFAFEEGTQPQWLHDLLSPRVWRAWSSATAGLQEPPGPEAPGKRAGNPERARRVRQR